MAITLTYLGDLARVRVDVTGIPAAVDHVLIERSTDGVTWATVRGGSALTPTAGAVSVDDYEFPDGVPVTYRASLVDTSPATFIAAGAAATGNNSSVAPALPAGWAAGDTFVALASIRNSGTGTVNVPAGWTSLVDFGNVRLLGRRAVAGDTAPTITFTGGAANADTIAQVAAFHNAELVPLTSNTQLNASAQDIAYPALTVPQDGSVVLVAGWKQDDWTSVAQLAGMTEIGEPDSTAGDDAGLVWDYVIQTTAANIAAASFTVTGGAVAISRAMVVALEPAAYLTQESASITPSLAGVGCQDTPVWLKSIARPFLNRVVSVVQRGDPAVVRKSRAGIFDIVGRSFPIAVNDVRSGRNWTMYVRTFSSADTTDLDLLFASGDVLFIHVPAVCAAAIPGGYVSVGDVTRSWHPLRPAQQLWTLPVTEVAPPGPDVVGATITWQGVLNTYGSWQDLISANGSWADVLANIGSPSDVIVP
jgi:hypothetical protein